MSKNTLSLFAPPKPAVDSEGLRSLPVNSQQDGVDLREIGRTLLRRKFLILATILILTGTGVAVMSSLTPRYTAEALLMVGDQQPHMLDLQSVVTGAETELTESEIQIIRSRRIARMVIEKLGLLKSPALRETAKAGGNSDGWLSEIGRQVSAFFDRVQKDISPTAKSTAVAANAEGDTKMSKAVDSFIKHLDVSARGRSRVVSIAYETEDPKTAAAVANAIADTYIQDELNTKLQATVEANQWLSARVGELRNQVVGTDRLVQQRKSEAGITEGKQVDLINEQISSLSEQLILAGADRAQADAKLQEAHSSGTLSDVSASPVVQKLRGDQAELRQRLAQASQVMGDKNPTIIQLNAQIDATTAALNAEAGKIVAGLANTASVARAREQALRTALAALKEEAGRTDAADVDINAQQREALANHNLYDRLLSRAKETSIEGGLQQPDAHVISHADVPILPSYPNKPLVLVLCFIGATLIASLLVIGLESIDQGFRDLSHVEQTLGVSALGYVPRLRGGEKPEMHVLSKPFSAYSEAIRSVYTSLILSDVDHPPKIVLITSSLPGEAKSATSIALARLVARSGKKVVVIDSDLRKPRVHEEFGVPLKPGLIDYLAGKSAIGDVLLKDTHSEAFVLPPGTFAPNPTDVFSSDNMQKLLRTLSASFDLIILDSAPLLAVSDTRNLCRLADKVLFVLRWHHTRKAAAGPAIRQIINAGGNLAGVLVTLTDMRKLPNHSESAYYQRQLVKYYQKADS